MDKKLLVKIFVLGIIVYFLFDFFKHARIIVTYPLNVRFIFLLIGTAIVYYSLKRIWKNKN